MKGFQARIKYKKVESCIWKLCSHAMVGYMESQIYLFMVLNKMRAYYSLVLPVLPVSAILSEVEKFD
jgi:hypothetical protein